MADNDTQKSNGKGADYPLTSVVRLKKGYDGVVQANPASYVHLRGGTSYSVKCKREELKAEASKPPQRINESGCPVAVTKESIIMRLAGVLSILITAAGALFVVKHKRLMDLTKTWQSKCKG